MEHEYGRHQSLNTKVYDLMFLDGSVQRYATNTISENIYFQVDEEVR